MQIFEQLPESAQQSAFDFIQYLFVTQNQLDWDDVARLEADAIKERIRKSLLGLVVRPLVE